MDTASWIIRNRHTAEVIGETFNAAVVAALNTAKYEAVPIMQYLQELNRKIKQENAENAFRSRREPNHDRYLFAGR